MNWDFRDAFQHSIWFLKDGETVPKNSIEDFRMLPKERYHFKTGEPDFINEEIEGRSGSYDWWRIVEKDPVPLKKSNDTLKFVVLTDYYDYNWIDEFDALIDYFDSSLFKIWLNDKPHEIATGRIWIESSGWKNPSSGTSEVTLNYTLTEEIEND